MIPGARDALAGFLLLATVSACSPADPGGGGRHETSTAAIGSAPTRSPAADAILITIDTLRADTLGFMGDPRVSTPVLDRLAATGWVFESARAHAVLTLPSHASILTGRLPYEHGIRTNSGFVLPTNVPTMATRLGAAGFVTAAFVAAFPLDARFGLDRGFDTYDDRYPRGRDADFVLPERRGDQVVEAALAWWRAHAGERRFLWVHLFDPHAPYEPEARFRDGNRDPYLGEVAAVDAYLEPLLEPFLAGGEDTPLVLFTSDHGEGLGDHGETTHGLFAYESTLRVPLVIAAPGLEPGRSDAAVGHVDLLPTLLAALGLEPDPDLPGRNLLATPLPPVPTYFEAMDAALTRGWAPLRGIVLGGYKAIALPIPELYDLAADPDEMANLAAARRSHHRELVALLPEESRWPPPRSAASSEETAALESLGYLTGSAPVRETYTAADDPKNLVAVDRQVHRFIDLYQRRQLAEAERLIRTLLEKQPKLGLAYYYYSQLLLEAGRPGEALEVLRRSHDRGVATDAATRQLGLLFAQAGRPEQAVAVLEPLAAGGDPASLNALGIALADAGRTEAARSTLLRVFERDPSNGEAHRNLALVAVRSGDWEGAARHAREALELDSAEAGAWNYLAISLYNRDRKDEAVDAWERAATADPGNWDVLYNLGLVAAEIGRVETARRALESFLAGAPPDRYREDLAKARALLAQLPGS